MTTPNCVHPRERLLDFAPGSAASGKPDKADDPTSNGATGHAPDLSTALLRARPSR